MTQVLGLLGSGLGPAGIVAAWVYLGRAGAIAVAALGLVLVAYLTGSHQATVAADLASCVRDNRALAASLAEERRQVLAAASIAAADARRAMAAKDEAQASAKRLADLEAYLAGNPAGTCATSDDARRLKAL